MGWPNNFVQGVYNALGSLIGVSDGAGGQIGLAATYTWATKPLASAYIGTAFISDIGVGGSYWISNGTEWKPLNGFVTLYQNNVQGASVTGVTSLDTLLTYNIPENLLGLNGKLVVDIKLTVKVITASTTLKVNIGGTQAWAFGTSLFASDTALGLRMTSANRNSNTLKLGSTNTSTDYGGGTNAVTHTKYSVNTSVSQDLTVTIQNGNVGSSYNQESISIMLVSP